MNDHAVFDEFATDYDQACELGLSLTGEDRNYFAVRRIDITAKSSRPLRRIERIIDFGCGVGSSTSHFLEVFPNAEFIGFDPSRESILEARASASYPRATFACDLAQNYDETTDLVYCNGVFHHIAPSDRGKNLEHIYRCLKPGGLLAFWENNPWNPGTRWVMSRIPFDRDAIPLSYREAAARIKDAGFSVIHTRSYFYFPRILKFFRRLEPMLTRFPFGGQYCVFAQKPPGTVESDSSSEPAGESHPK